jgi:hypothetical protein
MTRFSDMAATAWKIGLGEIFDGITEWTEFKKDNFGWE